MSNQILDCPLAMPLLTADTSAPLAHYTSPVGLVGIADDKGFWATHTAFLNDNTESNHYVKLADQFVQKRLRETSLAEDERVLLSILVRENPLRYFSALLPNANNVFVVSFSENRDQLSQWRAYCRQGGYSVAYRLPYLRALARAQDFYIGRCEYDPETKIRIIESLFGSTLERYREELETAKRKPTESFGGGGPEEKVLLLYHKSLHYYGPLLKHEAFREEQEWRAVLGPLPVARTYGVTDNMVTATWEKVRFRGGSNVVIPCCYFYFAQDGIAQEDAVSVIAGPSSMKGRGEHVIRAYVQRRFGAGTTYSVSKTPFDPL